MTNRKDPAAGVRDDFRARQLTADLIANGRLPSVDELLVGHTFARGDIATDAHIWANDVMRRSDDYADEVVDAASVIADVGHNSDIAHVTLGILEEHRETDSATRMLIYIACSENDVEVRARLATIIGLKLRVVDMTTNFDAVHLGFVQAGLMAGFYRSMAEYQDAGYHRVRTLSATWASFAATRDDDDDNEYDDIDDDTLDLLAAVAEDRAEIDTRPRPRPNPKKPRQGVVVVPKLGIAARGTGSSREITKVLISAES